MKDPWRLDTYQQSFEAIVAEAIGKSGNVAVSAEFFEDILKTTLPEIADIFSAALMKRSTRMLREQTRLRRDFVKGNIRRWRKGFNLLECLIVISQETGDAINNALRQKAWEENDALFEAITSNHARAIQVSKEILALMISGFPDGALGRWRTLHEIAVVSMFLSEEEQDTAERYILHDRVTSYKRAKNYMEHHERANLQPIAPKVIEDLKVMHDEIVGKYGASMKFDYGWAAKALGMSRPTFADLEVATKLDHWRPRYKWATINTHGAYHTLNSTLATSECKEPTLAIGESNSGMTDPAHMTAISLSLATMPIIMLEPNLDRLAFAAVMQRFSDDIGETFWLLDEEVKQRVENTL